jgi:hypothetical protein
MIGFIEQIFRSTRNIDLSLAFEKYTKTVRPIISKKKPVLEDKTDQSDDSNNKGKEVDVRC